MEFQWDQKSNELRCTKNNTMNSASPWNQFKSPFLITSFLSMETSRTHPTSKPNSTLANYTPKLLSGILRFCKKQGLSCTMYSFLKPGNPSISCHGSNGSCFIDSCYIEAKGQTLIKFTGIFDTPDISSDHQLHLNLIAIGIHQTWPKGQKELNSWYNDILKIPIQQKGLEHPIGNQKAYKGLALVESILLLDKLQKAVCKPELLVEIKLALGKLHELKQEVLA